ncbi:MAG: hypothetical protein M1423_07155 [Acidobacteria bacterium]|nr:hypothetical protein [Acidobacteriota bacterium]
MSILLAPPHVRCYGRVRFLPVNVVLQTIHPRRSPLPVVFSPWVITPGSVTAPAIMVGGAVVRWDQWSIEIEAPTSDVILWPSQERPKLQ